jgi:hypothetical protein
VKPSKTVAPGRLLTQVAGEGRTGALVVGGQPGGTVYLSEGQVTYAESPAAPGAGELLTASGRLAGRTWQAALDAGTPRSRVGALLVEHGHLTQGELELCVLGAIYDAGFFALAPAAAPAEFADGVAHWLGTVVRVDAQALARESGRRTRLLEQIFDDARVDTAPVNPVPRPPRERITVTAPQWELLVHADGQRTPADLALLLGRSGYATVQELRRLAAAGLLELPPEPNPDVVRLPRTRGPAVGVHRPVPGVDQAPTVPLVTAVATAPAPTPIPASAPAGTGGDPRPPRLTRRKPGAKLPKDLPDEGPPVHTGTDEVLLKRIRTALRALR